MAEVTTAELKAQIERDARRLRILEASRKLQTSDYRVLLSAGREGNVDSVALEVPKELVPMLTGMIIAHFDKHNPVPEWRKTERRN